MGQRDELGMAVNNGMWGVHTVGKGVGRCAGQKGCRCGVWGSVWWGAGDEFGMGTCVGWDELREQRDVRFACSGAGCG